MAAYFNRVVAAMKAKHAPMPSSASASLPVGALPPKNMVSEKSASRGGTSAPLHPDEEDSDNDSSGAEEDPSDNEEEPAPAAGKKQATVQRSGKPLSSKVPVAGRLASKAPVKPAGKTPR